MAIELANGENILRQNMGNYKGKGFFGTKSGTFYLTNKRLIFAKASKGMFLLLGAGSNFIPATNVMWEIPLEKIIGFGIERKKIGAWHYVETSEEKFTVAFMSKDWVNVYIKDAITNLGKSVVADGEVYKVM